MKKMIFLMLTLLIMGAASMNAQVTIGSESLPQDGAVLDLSKVSDQKLGLLLPWVSLTSTSGWQLRGSSTNGAGMLVYNINPDITGGNGVGVYLWDGVSAWQPLKSNLSAAIDVLDFVINPSTPVEIWDQASQVFTITEFFPPTASYQGVTWEIASGADVIELINPGITGCTVKGLQPGSAQIVVKSIDGKTSKLLNITVKEVTVTEFSLDKSTLTLITGTSPVSGTITAQSFVYSGGSGSGATVAWSIEGTQPADTQVNFSGNTYTVTPGATHTGTFGVTATIGSVSHTCEVTVINWPAALLLSNAAKNYSGTDDTNPAENWTDATNTALSGTQYSSWQTGGTAPATKKNLMVSQYVYAGTADNPVSVLSTTAGPDSYTAAVTTMPTLVNGINWENAVKLCANSTEAGYTDWYLPNSMEVDALYNANLLGFTTLGTQVTVRYWSSTEKAEHSAWNIMFSSGSGGATLSNTKADASLTSVAWLARCVRRNN